MFFSAKVTNSEQLSDEEVLVKSLTEPAYFAILTERYQSKLLAKAKQLLPYNPETAQDVVQDTFVKVYLYGPRFKKQEGASFKSWIYRILINTCFTHYQKIKRDREATLRIDEETMQFVDPESLKEFNHRLDTDLVSSLIAKLPLMLRRVSQAYFIDGLDYDQIAIKEGVTEGVIRTRIHRAKKQIEKFKSLTI